MVKPGTGSTYPILDRLQENWFCSPATRDGFAPRSFPPPLLELRFLGFCGALRRGDFLGFWGPRGGKAAGWGGLSRTGAGQNGG